MHMFMNIYMCVYIHVLCVCVCVYKNIKMARSFQNEKQN